MRITSCRDFSIFFVIFEFFVFFGLRRVMPCLALTCVLSAFCLPGWVVNRFWSYVLLYAIFGGFVLE